ncbi:MAG: hypothetical protein L3J31_06305 [Bacteroidales bacterium]|nr:hypothetical protein [Bacteroidales bacterium]MCF6342401.1 hypothetical protein [Bacteroidales bacterium]
MKKLIIILLTLFAMQTTSVLAQTDIVNFEAILLDVTTITVTAGQDISVTFATSDDYNNGFDVITPVTTVEVVALLDWEMSISAPDFDNADGGGDIIPINNVGVWCEATGVHQFGVELTCLYTTITTPVGLTNADQLLIGNGTGNNGDAADNSFNLNWEMGSMNGSMNPNSMFSQVADGTIGSLGTYNTVITLTLTTL